jgi:hypothetical protein
MNYINTFFISIFLFLISICKSQTLGLISNQNSAEGYILFSPNSSNNTYLIDKCGNLVNSWVSAYKPGVAVYLLEDGTLLRSGRIANPIINGGGLGGIIEQSDWNSNILWSYTLSSETESLHHDFKKLPNGNILAIVWVLKTVLESKEAGRDTSLLGSSVWSERIIEIQPNDSIGGTIVWEWNVWDHLIQDFDQSKNNFGVVSEHPELININFKATIVSDWLHFNSIDYNEELDQIILSANYLDEIWIIDHSTTTAEAASHTGGIRNKGGDLLYRWGNPEAYGRGTEADKKMFKQHCPKWIESGLEGEGQIIFFNNGNNRPDGNYSSVEILKPALDKTGNYLLEDNQAFGPTETEWKYLAPDTISFFSINLSNAQRLPNGNTLICEGAKGRFFEIDVNKNKVWEYISPIGIGGSILSQGDTPVLNVVFRTAFYPSNYIGFEGQQLIAGEPIELNPIQNNCEIITKINSTNNQLKPVIIENPFNEMIKIILNEKFKSITIKLFSLEGKVVNEWKFINQLSGTQLLLDCRSFDLINGIYFLEIKDNLNANIIRRIFHN